MSGFAKAFRVAVIALVAVAVFLLVAGPVTELPFRIPRNYNEGWNALHAERALAGDRLYPPLSAPITNNYPPLSFYLVGTLGLVVGDNIVAGRIVALVAFLFVAVGVGLVAGRLCKRVVPGLVAALLFAGYLAALHPGYIAMNDPQWLGQALQMAALLLLTTASGREPRLGLAMLAMVAACLVKHNLLSLPLATTLWLLAEDRRQFGRWIAMSAIALAATAAFLWVAFGPDLLRAILFSPRQYSIADAAIRAARWFAPLLPLLCAVALFAWFRPESRSERLLLWYVSTSAVLGLLFLGGGGVNMNVLYDLMVGLFIVGGLVLHRIGVRLHGRWPSAGLDAAVTGGLALGLLAVAPTRIRAELETFANLSSREERVIEDIRLLAAASGPVACESLALCYWAGRPFELDFFAVGQMLRTGSLSEERFAALLEARSFELIQVDGRGRSRRLTAGVNQLLARRFERRPRPSGCTFLVPRRG